MPAPETVKVGDRVVYVTAGMTEREAEVVAVFNPGAYPRGGCSHLAVSRRGPDDSLDGEVPTDPKTRRPLDGVLDSLGRVVKRSVLCDPSGRTPGTWHFGGGK